MSNKIKISDYFIPTERQRVALSYNGTGKRVYYGGAKGGGKELPVWALVQTPKGWKQIGELKVGDSVTNPVTGGSTKVIGVFPQGVKPIYKFTCDDGAVAYAGLEHLWAYKRPKGRRPFTKYSSERDYAVTELGAEMPNDQWNNYRIGTTAELIGMLKNGEHPRIPLTKPVIFTTNSPCERSPLPPYLIGLLLGDGCLAKTTIYSADQEIIDYLLELGFEIQKDREGKCKTLAAKGELKKKIISWLRVHKLSKARSWEKFIPKYIFTSSLRYRTEFIRGLMDTDGYVDERGRAYYSTTSDMLAVGIMNVIRSLGGKAYDRIKIPSYIYNGEKKEGRVAHDILIQLPKTSALFKLTRKKARCTDKWNGGYEMMRAITSIDYVGDEEAVCIKVDSPQGLFVTEDYIVTHNTSFAVFLAFQTAMKYPGIKVAMIRQNYRELNDQIIHQFLSVFPERIFKYRYREKNMEAKFENNSMIMFRSVESMKDVNKIWGIEFQLIIIDEANLFEEAILKKIFLSNRNATITDYKATIYMTGNPGGISDYYFKTRFVNPDYMKWDENEKVLADLHVFVPAKVYDNPHIQQEYITSLQSLDSHQRAAYLDGDFNSFDGQFLESWTESKHVVNGKNIELQQGWRRVGGLDFGMTREHPTVLVVMAQNPDTFQIYIVAEYVNWGGDFGTYIKDIADLCNEYEVDIVYADPAMWGDKRGIHGESSHTMFEAEGIPLEPASNSRVNGWRVVKRWLEYKTLPDEEPLLKVFDTCSKTIETAPLLRYAERGVSREDCDSRGPDDAWDAIRYALVRGFYYPNREDIEMVYMLDTAKLKHEAAMREKYKTSFDIIRETAYYG